MKLYFFNNQGIGRNEPPPSIFKKEPSSRLQSPQDYMKPLLLQDITGKGPPLSIIKTKRIMFLLHYSISNSFFSHQTIPEVINQGFNDQDHSHPPSINKTRNNFPSQLRPCLHPILT